MNINNEIENFKLTNTNFEEFLNLLKSYAITQKRQSKKSKKGGRRSNATFSQELMEDAEEMIFPKFLLNQISFGKCKCLYNLFCCCCSKQGNNLDDIEESDVITYDNFKTESIEIYSKEETSNENSLRFFYIKALNCDLSPDFVNERWKNFGFTSDDPRSDISIGGYYSLLFINYFINNNDDDFEEIKDNILLNKSGKKNNFSMLCILLTVLLRLALDAFPDEIYAENLRKKFKVKAVEINQFVNFNRKYNNSQQYPFEIMSEILLKAYEEINGQESSDLYSDFIILKNTFDSIFYKEMDTPFEYSEKELDWSLA